MSLNYENELSINLILGICSINLALIILFYIVFAEGFHFMDVIEDT